MKALILAAMGAALIAGTASAQNNPPPPPPAAGPAADAPPPPPGPGPMDDAMMPPPGPGGRPGPHGGPPPPPPSKAAHFIIEREGTLVDVKCAEDEPMKACADILMSVLNHAGLTPEPRSPAKPAPTP